MSSLVTVESEEACLEQEHEHEHEHEQEQERESEEVEELEEEDHGLPFTTGTCCFCGDACNPLSQACKPCMRSPFLSPEPQET